VFETCEYAVSFSRLSYHDEGYEAAVLEGTRLARLGAKFQVDSSLGD
jgi:hypothetical protein